MSNTEELEAEEIAQLLDEVQRLREERRALRQASRDQRLALQQRNRYIRHLQQELEALTPDSDVILMRAAANLRR
jgi:Tfp pilus assembly protein PilN